MSNPSPRSTNDWYEIVEGSEILQQGDLILSVPVTHLLSPEDPEGETEAIADVKEFDLVVLTQSCDLEFEKVDQVLLCPYFFLDEFMEQKLPTGNRRDKLNYKNKLRKEEVVGYHLLDCCELPSFEFDYPVVDLKNPVALPFEFINALRLRDPQRIRLLPPYREHLSQAFARTFMRVGLPKNIPEFG